MRSVARSTTFVTAAVGVATVLVLATAATGFAGSSSLEPAKTIGPAPSTSLVANTIADPAVVPVTAVPAVPTSLIPTPTLLTSGTAAPGVPVPTMPAPGFDAVAFFTDVFTTLDENPQDLDTFRSRVSSNSSADFFLLYVYLTALVIENNTDSEFPAVTVAASAVGLDVCAEGQPSCDVFSDFVLQDGLLASFSINGVSLDARFGVVVAPRSYESLTFEAGVSYRQINQELLAVVVLMSAEPGSAGAEIRWSEAVFTDVKGRALPIDLDASLAPTSVPGGGNVSVLLRFADAPPGGTLTMPVSSDGFATSSTATIVYAPV